MGIYVHKRLLIPVEIIENYAAVRQAHPFVVKLTIFLGLANFSCENSCDELSPFPPRYEERESHQGPACNTSTPLQGGNGSSLAKSGGSMQAVSLLRRTGVRPRLHGGR